MNRYIFPLNSYRVMAAFFVGSLGLWAYSARPLTAPGDKLDENRFTKVVLAEKLNEPLEMAILRDERVLFIERHGQVQLYSGQLLGHTETLLPNESNDPADLFKPSLARVAITPVIGQHDLYFVFKNEKAGKSPLFVPVTVQFSN